ncbi:hypothetical protein BD413DRAFT_134427 [Trametes elegans]|nr:hypothetical protein BD413DRAFT_134427 [Trametes elegans]
MERVGLWIVPPFSSSHPVSPPLKEFNGTAPKDQPLINASMTAVFILVQDDSCASDCVDLHVAYSTCTSRICGSARDNFGHDPTLFNSALLKEGLSTYVKNFEFNKMNVNDDTQDDFLHLYRTPAFGRLSSESIKKMDEKLQGNDHLHHARTQESARRGSGSVRLEDDRRGAHAEHAVRALRDMSTTRSTSRRTRTTPNTAASLTRPPLRRRVSSLLVGDIKDEDVYNSMHVDIGVTSNIVAQTGVTITSVESAV